MAPHSLPSVEVLMVVMLGVVDAPTRPIFEASEVRKEAYLVEAEVVA
jgi:hypothetical protein